MMWTYGLTLLMYILGCICYLLTPRPYTRKDLMNNESLEFYINFVPGWVREVLVKVFDDYNCKVSWLIS